MINMRKLAVVVGIALNVVGLGYVFACEGPDLSARDAAVAIPASVPTPTVHTDILDCRPQGTFSMLRDAESDQCLEEVADASTGLVMQPALDFIPVTPQADTESIAMIETFMSYQRTTLDDNVGMCLDEHSDGTNE